MYSVSMNQGPLLDREPIRAAFTRLRDIDALFQPHGIALDEACNVATELGLPLLVAQRTSRRLRHRRRRHQRLHHLRPPRTTRHYRLPRTHPGHESPRRPPPRQRRHPLPPEQTRQHQPRDRAGPDRADLPRRTPPRPSQTRPGRLLRRQAKLMANSTTAT